MTDNWEIAGGKVLSDGRLERDTVHVAAGWIVETASAPSRVFDAAGLIVLPGIVDIHGDGFERQIMPRPNVTFDSAIALRETDRQLVANGITTAFHAVTISWEPGLRSLEGAASVVAAWQAARPSLSCDTRLHLRWETFALDAIDQVLDWLELEPKPILAYNDHTTKDHTTYIVAKAGKSSKLTRMVERTGLGTDAYLARLSAVWGDREAVPAAVEQLARAAAERGITLLAHDETSPADRARFRALGVRSSEFPMTFETAADARDNAEHVVLGAPNVLRGGSHNGMISAREAIGRGLCTVLASDYYYPALLYAPFRLADWRDPEFGACWDLVSRNPAEAAGLADRGEIRPGRRADLIMVDASDKTHPIVVAAMAGGRMVYRRDAAS